MRARPACPRAIPHVLSTTAARIMGLVLTAMVPTLPARAYDTPFPPAVAPKAAASQGLLPSDRVKQVFKTHCARCHQSGRTEHGREVDAFGQVLDLDAIARDLSLVRPGLPDVSPIYLKALTAHAPLDLWTNGNGPTGDDLDAIRDWIESVPANSISCSRSGPGDTEKINHLTKSWQTEFDTRQFGFVSLHRLLRNCATAERIKEARNILTTALSGIARQQLALETLGNQSALIAVPLDVSEKLTPAVWRRLTANAPITTEPAVSGAWLAAHIVSRPRMKDGSIDPQFDPAMEPADHDRLLALAQEWQAPVDLKRAAGELEISPAALWHELRDVTQDRKIFSARQLMSGTLALSDWIEVKKLFTNARNAVQAASADTRRMRLKEELNAPLRVALWTDKLGYNQGDLLTLSVMVNRACHLTVINIDPEGQARILYPNALDPDNLIAPRVTVQVPSSRAAYQLRLSNKGQETLLAVCQRHRRDIPGVRLNYERQLFPILGDWRGFLRVADAQDKKLQTEAARRAKRKRNRYRRRRNTRDTTLERLPAIDPSAPAAARAAVSIRIR